jgi:hypothetical protein
MVVQGDAQGLGALGRVLGHIAGHLLGQQPLVVLAVIAGEVADMELLSEGARVAATEGRTVADGERVAAELLRRAAGGRVASAVPIEGAERDGLVELRAEGTLPSFVPGVPGLPVRMRARMHEEESL